ncbi:TPA: hypothetical protein EYG96_03270 [Candidatus Gracilibacteria bacterium]|nr:hypothetical protein [Candidatus Peregrinibacteria bacterium]HIQ57035.1 hypothetical protein [Candidatus Gracilibacteria bacterium]HIQ57252.1 hypothetical protein [Candidatus Gracilibacteria bacterium]
MNTYVKISAIAVTTLIGSFIGFQKSNTEINTTQYETVIFATVLSSDELSSVEEKETASHFFAEAILGWTLAPDFKNQLNFGISSRKQERGNIIFEFTSLSEKTAEVKTEKFITTLNYKLSQYNTSAKTQFKLLLDTPITTEKSPNKSFWTMGGGIAGFFFGLFATELFIFLRRKEK